MGGIADMVKKAKDMGMKMMKPDAPKKPGMVQAASDAIKGTDEKGKALKEIMKDL
jgi:hypothetical protein